MDLLSVKGRNKAVKVTNNLFCRKTHFHVCMYRPKIRVVLIQQRLLLTYLCPSLPVEHRPSTTPRHRTLFWAALVIPDQLVPCCFSSASVSRLQLLRGRPLFLFPCGFQVKAWRVVLDAGFLWVCPIQPHFLRSICLATGLLSRSLPHVFISDLLLPLDFVDAPQTGVEECLDLSLHRLCYPPCLTSVKQD